MADQESSEFARVKHKVNRLNQFFLQVDADYLFNEMAKCISEDGVFYLEDFLDICEETIDIVNLQAYGWTSTNELKVLGVYNPSTGRNWYYILNLAEKLEDFRGVKVVKKNQEQIKKDDPVNHPSHYVSGGIECIDAIASALSCHKDPMAAWLTGQVMKYIWRWPLKNGLEDLKKARFYLDRLIKMEEEN